MRTLPRIFPGASSGLEFLLPEGLADLVCLLRPGAVVVVGVKVASGCSAVSLSTVMFGITGVDVDLPCFCPAEAMLSQSLDSPFRTVSFPGFEHAQTFVMR